MSRSLMGATGLLLAVSAVLAGCGDDDPFKTYCAEVKAQQAALSEDLAGAETTGLISALPEFEQLAAKAPADLEDEWAIVTSRIDSLIDALEAAGVDPATYNRKRPPEELSDEEREAIDAAAEALATSAMAEALAGVEQQARDVCKTPLTL